MIVPVTTVSAVSSIAACNAAVTKPKNKTGAKKVLYDDSTTQHKGLKLFERFFRRK